MSAAITAAQPGAVDRAPEPRRRAARRVLPGFRLTLTYTLLYLCLIVLIPLSALLFKTFSMTWDQFWFAVSGPRAVASYRLTFGASLFAAVVNLVFGLLLAWVLEHYGIDCTGKKVVVIGRSLVVGKPAAMMLLKKNATVTVCHTRTVDMPSVVKEADIVVVAAGKAGVIDGSYLREGQIVIDVGINVNEEGKLCGDVNFEEAEKIVDAITPVPRGVGGVTTSILLEHVVDAAIAQNR